MENTKLLKVVRGIFWLSLFVIVKLPFLIFYAGQFLLNSPFFPVHTAFLWGFLFLSVAYVCIGVYFNFCFLINSKLKVPKWHIFGVIFTLSLLFVPSPLHFKYQLWALRDSRYCDCALNGIIDPQNSYVFKEFQAQVVKRFKPDAKGIYNIHVPPEYLLQISKNSVVLSFDSSSGPKGQTPAFLHAITTKKGIALGDTENSVRNVYAGPYFVNIMPDKSRELVYSRPHSAGEEMHFIFRSGKLVSIEALVVQ